MKSIPICGRGSPALTLAMVIGVVPGAARAQEAVGRTAVVLESVTGELERILRRLVVKDDVHQNELIATEPNSASEIVFYDGTTLSVGPNSKLTLDKFVHDPRPS